jgi:hypothetical protein
MKNQIQEITDTTPGSTFMFDDLFVGQTVTQSITFSEQHLDDFIKLSGDRATIHSDKSYAESLGFSGRVIHGHLAISPFSGLIGMHLPGEGCVIRNHNFQFRKALYCEEKFLYSIKIDRLRQSFKLIELSMAVTGERGMLISGQTQCLLEFPMP